MRRRREPALVHRVELVRVRQLQQPHVELFDVLWRTAERLEQGGAIGRLHLAFLVEAVGVMGLLPDATSTSPRGMERFNLATAEWESGPPLGEDYLAVEEAERFLRIQGMDFDTLRAEDLPHDDRNRLVLHLVRYLQLHLSTPRTILSWEVLRTVLAS